MSTPVTPYDITLELLFPVLSMAVDVISCLPLASLLGSI